MAATPVAHPTGRSLFRGRRLSLIGVLALLCALLVVTVIQSKPPEPIPFDPSSSHGTGLRALYLWLEGLGYQVRRNDGLRYTIPDGTELLFVYPNQLSYTTDEADQLRAWVAAGHTLVLVGPHAEDAALERAFGVRQSASTASVSLEQQIQPLLPEGESEYLTDWYAPQDVLDLSAAPAAIPVFAALSGDPTVAVQAIGSGVVWHLHQGSALSNHALSNDAQGELLPALLRRVPAGSVVAFDTFHQFGLSRAGEQIGTLQDWLYRTPSGWATLFGAVALAGYLVSQGRRLGPALPSTREMRRREAAEFVQAMAGLARRAHLGSDIARHHRQRLKRGLAQRRPLSPDQPDAAFLAQLAAVQPPLAAETLAAVRATLDGLAGRPDEHQLVKLASAVDELLKLH